ncbi:MAG: glycosyltransferase family A protein [Anaerolineae bacterium]
MPTADRRAFVGQAIAYFLRQDYPNRELIVVDDGVDAVADLMPEDSRIRYLRLPGRRSVGAKRNLACAAAAGEIIVHWDDDDWSAARRLSYQVEELLRQGADLCGLSAVNYYDPRQRQAWQYVYPAHAPAWVGGNTLCYRKEQLARQPLRRHRRGGGHALRAGSAGPAAGRPARRQLLRRHDPPQQRQPEATPGHALASAGGGGSGGAVRGRSQLLFATAADSPACAIMPGHEYPSHLALADHPARGRRVEHGGG